MLSFFKTHLHIILLGLFLSGTGLGIIRVIRYEREQDIPKEQRISRDAGQKAKIKLEEIEQSMEQIPKTEFFESSTEVFYSFLIDRFSIPSSELDESGLAHYLSESNVSDHLADRTKEFFSQCVTVRYGGTPGGHSKPEMLNICRELINSLEA